MKIAFTPPFRKDYQGLSTGIQEQIDAQITRLLENPRHPSLRTKKIQGQDNIFEASVTMDIRITWQNTEDGIFLRNIGEHDKTLKTP